MKKAFLGFILGAIVAGGIALFSAAQITATNHVSFCASCHEMKVFHETWKVAAHGPDKHRGAVRARCVDCHLPHEGLIKYLITKGMAGMSDFYAHMTGKMATYQEWLEALKDPERKVKVYESGCRECHKELIGNGVPLKAILAHRAYLLRETDKTCISCHSTVGHGNIRAVLAQKIKQNKQGGEL